MLRNLKLSRPLAVIDLETTGFDVAKDRIVELSVLKIMPDGSHEHKTRRLNPGIPIPAEATAVHGITDADVANAPTFFNIAKGLLDFLEGCDLCGYNFKSFDLKILAAEFRRVGRQFLIGNRAIIDPMRVYHAFEKRDLSAAVKFYLNEDHAQAHSAEADVLATVAILEAMLHRYADLPRDVDSIDKEYMSFNTADPDGFFDLIDGRYRFTARCKKHPGKFLDEIAVYDPEYLTWMLGKDFFDDTKAIVNGVLDKVGTR